MSTKPAMRPFQHIDCNGCRANAHSEPERSEHIHVVGNCGEKKTLGSCFGVILYPIKNPTVQAHQKFSHAVKAHQGDFSAVAD